MNKIAFFTDSCVDILPEDIKKYDIHVIPFTVSVGEKSYLDGIDITNKEVWKLMSEGHILPKTAAGSPSDYSKAWKPFLDDGYEIIHCGIGAHLSNGFNAARIAKDYLKSDNIHIVDSNNLSAAIGMLILKGVVLKEKDMSAEYIANKMSNLSKHISSQFTVDDLEFLFKGGRCSGMSYLFSKALKIHPVLKTYADGFLRMQTKIRGHIEKACDFMLDEMKGKLEYIDKSSLTIIDVDNEEASNYLVSKVKEIIPDAKIYITRAGSIISCHCGPGTIGLMYFTKEEYRESEE